MPSSRTVGVGIFVIVGVLLFGGGLFLIGDRRQLFERSFVVGTEFANVSGLQNGANVRVSGLDAGEVLSIEVPPGPEAKFRVTMRVLERIRPLVRADSLATIQTDGIVGNKVVAISAGSSDSPEVADDGTIPSREPIEIADLLERGSRAFDTLYESVLSMQDDFEETVRLAAEMAQHADDLIEASGEDVQRMTASGRRVVEDVEAMARRVREGEGTLGKLLEDDTLYQQTTQIAENVRGSLEEVLHTARNIRELSEQSNRAFSQLVTENGGTTQGVLADLRETLASTKEATSNLAENMASLKRNWFFRGLFTDRGFYDLDRMTVAEYRAGALRKNNAVVRRKWLPAKELFQSVEGEEELSPEGKDLLDRSMADFLRFPEDSPLIIEAYSGAERRDERYLEARRRGQIVRDYLVEKFRLRPTYVGIMAMREPSPEGFSPAEEGGVVMALFHERDSEVTETSDATKAKPDSWLTAKGSAPNWRWSSRLSRNTMSRTSGNCLP